MNQPCQSKPEIEIENTIVLYPNPANEFLNIEINNPNTLKLINGNGIEIMTFDIEQNYQLPLTQLSAGLYFLQTQDGNLKKFVKQ